MLVAVARVLGFRVEGLGFRALALGFWVWGSGFGVCGLSFKGGSIWELQGS